MILTVNVHVRRLPAASVPEIVIRALTFPRVLALRSAVRILALSVLASVSLNLARGPASSERRTCFSEYRLAVVRPGDGNAGVAAQTHGAALGRASRA